jgi:MerR family redox-sensitive transcriptional activator SoxR
MDALPIGEVARRTGLNTSAIRYYENCRLIAPAGRSGGKRRYDESAVERLALIAFAKDAGFTLAEIRRLLSGFREGTPAAERWRALATAKLRELDEAAKRIETMRAILRRAVKCGCLDLEECGRRIASAAIKSSCA